jgi:hypothetical protein
MLLVGFERAISADERLQTYALDRAATGTGNREKYSLKKRIAIVQLSLSPVTNSALQGATKYISVICLGTFFEVQKSGITRRMCTFSFDFQCNNSLSF